MSSHQPSNNHPYHSTIPDLSLPEGGWKSSIPPHLLTNADPQIAWIMEEISKNTQATEFACRAVVAQNAHLKALNGKTFRNEQAALVLEHEVEQLKSQAKTIEPLVKPLDQFVSLWGYRVFRWGFYISVFFFFTYLLPFYLQNPFSIGQFFKFFFPGT